MPPARAPAWPEKAPLKGLSLAFSEQALGVQIHAAGVAADNPAHRHALFSGGRLAGQAVTARGGAALAGLAGSLKSVVVSSCRLLPEMPS